MNYHNIVHDDMLNGDGLRVTLFVSGCENCCEGCHNPQTWDYNSGIQFTFKELLEIEDELNKPYISGLTLSGGDPLAPCNEDFVGILVETIKTAHPHKSIWLYTGSMWEDVKGMSLMKCVDVLVDGRYVAALRDENAEWVGSTNQRVIDVKKSLESGTVVLWH